MKKTEATKNAIINATIKLLRQNGNVTVKEISEEAHVNIAAINYHFIDKQSLLVIVVKRVIGDLKIKIDSFLNSAPITSSDVRNELKQFIDDFYKFSFENVGIIEFLLMPLNKDLLDICYKSFFTMFSVDSEFTYKIISRMSAFGISQTQDDLKAKYMLLFSSLVLPMIFQLDLFDRNNKQHMPLNDPELKEKYIEQLTKIILS